MECRALDTSVAVALLYESHLFHRQACEWAEGSELRLSGHALAETYAVITRMPDDARLEPEDAVQLIDSLFGESLALKPDGESSIHRRLASCGVAGGATYDALVAFAALDNGLVLATRDARAMATYHAVGVEVEVLT